MSKRIEEEEARSRAREASRDVVDRVLRDSEESAAFGSDSNDESDVQTDDWTTSDAHERDLYGRGRFDR